MNHLDQVGSMVVFAKIVETRSFTETAQALGMSKSAVSKEIARLEASLGVELLRRTTRKLEVNDIGRVFYEYCVRMLAEVRGADMWIRRFHDAPVGNLRIVAPVTFGNRVIVPALSEFIVRYVHVEVNLELTDRAVEVDKEGIDIAVHIGDDVPALPNAKRLMDVTWGLYASPAWLARHAPIHDPEDLGAHPFLLFRGPAYTTVISLRKQKRTVELRARCVLRSNNSMALLNACAEGTGIAYLPCYVAQDAVKRGALARVLPDWASGKKLAYAIWREDDFISPRILLFIECLIAHLRKRHTETGPPTIVE